MVHKRLLVHSLEKGWGKVGKELDKEIIKYIKAEERNDYATMKKITKKILKKTKKFKKQYGID